MDLRWKGQNEADSFSIACHRLVSDHGICHLRTGGSTFDTVHDARRGPRADFSSTTRSAVERSGCFSGVSHPTE
jgi:hypothetical protein